MKDPHKRSKKMIYDSVRIGFRKRNSSRLLFMASNKKEEEPETFWDKVKNWFKK